MKSFDSVFKNGKKLWSSSFLNNLSISGNKILYNQIVLYFIFIVVLSNLFYLAVDGDYMTICVSLLIGFTTSFFSKNMVVILFMALTISNILRLGLFNDLREGYENTIESIDDTAEVTSDSTSDTTIVSATPQKCQGNRECRTTEYCCNDSCVVKCTKNSNCGETEFCNNGLCIPNPPT